jgi:hypothetical protein
MREPVRLSRGCPELSGTGAVRWPVRLSQSLKGQEDGTGETGQAEERVCRDSHAPAPPVEHVSGRYRLGVAREHARVLGKKDLWTADLGLPERDRPPVVDRVDDRAATPLALSFRLAAIAAGAWRTT